MVLGIHQNQGPLNGGVFQTGGFPDLDPVLPFLGFFWFSTRKTRQLPRIVCPCRTLKIFGKDRENTKITKEIPRFKFTKEIQKKKQGKEGPGTFFGTFWDFPDFSGIFPICSGMVWGFSRFVLFLFLGLLRAPTRNSPERVRVTIWTFPEKSGKHPGLETPRFSFSQQKGRVQKGLRKLNIGHHQLHSNYIPETWNNHITVIDGNVCIQPEYQGI